MLDTQLNSWQQKKNSLVDSQKCVFDAIADHRDGVALFELVTVLGWPVNRISGRVTELAAKQMIFDSGVRRVNPETGKTGAVWKARKTQSGNS